METSSHRLSATLHNMYEVWDGMYIGINNANLLLSKITPDSYKADNKNTYMGEAYFLRGFNYLKLVSQYGEFL